MLTSPSPVHYAVLYRDDSGPVQSYMGGDDRQWSPLGNPQGENLPNSLVLDGRWGQEILFCLWSEGPFTLEEARQAAAEFMDGSSGTAYVAENKVIHVHTALLSNKSL